MSSMKIRTLVVVLTSAIALSGCAVVPYSPNYDDHRVYQSYPPPAYYGPTIAPPVIIWGGWFGRHWHGHRHGGHGGWRR